MNTRNFIFMLTVVFWGGLLGVVYAYVVFPLLSVYFCRRRSEPGSRLPAEAQAHPIVTVIIPAYNEEASLDAKIRNTLAADYPRELLDIIVVSDASTDRTNAIAAGFEAEGVRLIVQESRRGKSAGLNRAIAMARGPIVVFTDANASFSPATVRTLVGYFSNRRVGLVSGYTRYTTSTTGEVAEATNAYTSLERAIKTAESRWGCCVGADGAIFAMRRSLYRTLRADDINDFVLPLSVIEQGYQCVLAEDAFCSENSGKDLDSEFRRQSRIANRSLRALWRRRRLLNPIRFPAFSFFLFSHKVLRFLVPVLLLLSAASLVVLALNRNFYFQLAEVAAASAAFLALASVWPRLVSSSDPVSRITRLATVFTTTNAAMLHGWWKFVSGKRDVTWHHDRAVSR